MHQNFVTSCLFELVFACMVPQKLTLSHQHEMAHVEVQFDFCPHNYQSQAFKITRA